MKKKILSIFILIILLSQFTISFAATLSEQKKEINEQISDATAQQKKVEEELSTTMKEIDELEADIEENEEKIYELNKELINLNNEITEIKSELKKKEEEYNMQEDSLKERLVANFEMGQTTYLDVLLNSTGILDFISNYYIVSEILQNDNDILNSIEDKKNEIEIKKQQVEEKQIEVKNKKAEQEKIKAQLVNQKNSKNSKINQLSEEEKNLQSLIDEFKNDLKSIEAQLEEQARKAGSSSVTKSYTGGVLTFPCLNYSRISSYFGPRSSPGGGVGSTNHKGIDIAAPRGSTIVSAADGVVVTASNTCSHDYAKTVRTKCSCGGGYGNYIMINHGNGLVTMYAHCSKISIKSGQSVSAGQKIGEVGNTGYSTGSHLHFGVLLNGTYVNPISYLGL